MGVHHLVAESPLVAQFVVNALPAGAVREPAVHEDDGGLGSILRVGAHGFSFRTRFSSGGSTYFLWIYGARICILARASEKFPAC